MALKDFLGTLAGAATSTLSANPFGVAGALAGGLFGILQKGKANRIDNNNPLPQTAVNPILANNYAEAQRQARIGLNGQQYNNALTQINTGLTSGLRLAGRMGSTASVASILRGYDAGVNQLTAQDQAARQSNQRFAAQQGQVLANEQQRVFNWNKAQPYLRKQQQAASLRNAGNLNTFGALGTLSTINSLSQGSLGSSGQASQTANPMTSQYAMNFGMNPFGFGR